MRGWVDGGAEELVKEEYVLVAALEIKTRVAPARLGKDVTLANPDMIKHSVGDHTLVQYVQTEHRGQVLHQAIVMDFRRMMYVAAAETGILYSVLIRILQNLRRYSFGILDDLDGPVVTWVHQ